MLSASARRMLEAGGGMTSELTSEVAFAWPSHHG